VPTAQELDKASLAVFHYAVHATVSFVDLDCGCAPASGTLVAIGDHLLVMTAGHAVPNNPNARLQFLSRVLRPIGGPRLAVSRSGRSQWHRIDVGFLELAPAVAPEYLDARSVAIEQVADLRTGRPERPIAFVGAVREHMPDATKTRVVGTPIEGFATTVIPEQEWDELKPFPSAEGEADSDVDVFLDFEQGSFRRGLIHDGDPATSPSGMSGGGYWDCQCDCGGVWSPERARLFAIQSSWDSKRTENRYVRGVQVIHWLRLIHHEYQDLRDFLSDRFPRLSEHAR
jgi:hypothetical protein